MIYEKSAHLKSYPMEVFSLINVQFNKQINLVEKYTTIVQFFAAEKFRRRWARTLLAEDGAVF